MQFIVTGLDGMDSGAPERRAKARADHLALGDRMKAEGTLLHAAALLDDVEAMVGSVLVCDFPSREALDAWLETEPYVTGEVWITTDIRPCRVSPAFLRSAASS